MRRSASGFALSLAWTLAWVQVPVVASVEGLVAPAPAWAGTGEPADAPGGGVVQVARTPRASGALPLAARFRLRSAFDLALERLERVPECRGLFGELGADGLDLLSGALFEVPEGPEQNRLCLRATAFTRPGSGRIVVCPVRLRATPRRELAAILLHEALHLAGLGEWPHVPDAPTPEEITRTVKVRCAL